MVHTYLVRIQSADYETHGENAELLYGVLYSTYGYCTPYGIPYPYVLV